MSVPTPGPEQLLIQVRACGVCRTDLHVVDSELPDPKLPLVLGHEIVGIVAGKGERVERFATGDRVGVPWLGWTCGTCPYCRSGRENLCDRARFTGYQIDGGYAEYTVADQRFCFALPASYSDTEAAPLLCAGLIGYRSLVMAGNAGRPVSTASAPLPTSSFRWHIIKGGKSLPSREPGIRAARNSHAVWERSGPGPRMSSLRTNWTRPLSSLRQGS